MYSLIGWDLAQPWKKKKMVLEHGSLLTHLPLDKMAAIVADDIFKCIFLNENDRIPIQISRKFVPRRQ